MLSIASACQAEFAGEFLLFPQLVITQRADLDSNSTFDQSTGGAGVDFFVTIQNRNFRFLGEFLLSDEEQEFERFQMGWSHNKNLIWLGLFHNPIGYWNTSYHHGSYLQTSISRPAIVEFEDHGGILPAHLAGFLVEGAINFGEQEWGYALALASGPEHDDTLKPWDLLNPDAWSGDMSATLNVHRDFGSNIPTRVGFFLNSTQIPSTATGINEIQQVSTGLYGYWESSRWRWHGSSFYVQNRLKRPDGSEKSAFFNAYLQTEYSPDHRWTFYGRIEHTWGDEGDAYLTLFPNFVTDRVLGGVRYDFTNSNALKLEFSADHVQEDDFGQVLLQWSAMF